MHRIDCLYLRFCLGRSIFDRYPIARKSTSDNGTLFHRADIELKPIYSNITSGIIADWLLENQISWTFITPKTPWAGNQWERLIGCAARCLRKVLGTSVPYFRAPDVVLCGVQAIVNRRPLTNVSYNPGELRALTPSCLISGYMGSNLFPETVEQSKIRGILDPLVSPSVGSTRNVSLELSGSATETNTCCS